MVSRLTDTDVIAGLTRDLAATREEAIRQIGDLRSALLDAARDRDIHRQAEDRLARELEHMKAVAHEFGELHRLAHNGRAKLRVEVQAIGDDMAGNAEAYEAEAETPRERHLSATLADFAARLLALLADGPTPTPNTTQPLYVDHEGKPTGEPRVEVTANVHIVPASPASSPTTDPATPDGHTGHTDTQEANRG